MELKKTESILEGMLFAAGEPVDSEKLCEILDVDAKTLKSVINRMIDSYNFERRGIHIIQIEDSYQMCTRPEYFDYIQQITEPKRSRSLSGAALEVLAVVAYKQPVTRAVIEDIRGVSCETSVQKLMEQGLIEEVGRLDAPGRPILFGTTVEFLRSFGLKSLSDLPDFDALNSFEKEFSVLNEAIQLEIPETQSR